MENSKNEKKNMQIFKKIYKKTCKNMEKKHTMVIFQKKHEKNEKQCFMFHRSLFFSNTREFEM